MSPDLVAGVLGGVFALVALVGVFALVRFAARGERVERPEVGPWVGHRPEVRR